MAAALVGTPTIGSGATIAIPSHVKGDVIVIFAFRDGSTTAPSTPAASGTVPTWNAIDSGGANTCAMKSVYAIATGSTHTSGTFTNATHLTVAVIRGCDQSGPLGGHGRSDINSATTGSVPSITQQVTDGSSLLLCWYAHRANTTAYASAPSGYTRQCTRVGAGIAGGALNTKDSSTSDGSQSQTYTSDTNLGGEVTQVEFKAGTAVPGSFRQWNDNFDATTQETACVVTADTASPLARVTATNASASDTGDQATANITAAGKIPSGNEGRIRFHLRTPKTFAPTNNVTILDIKHSATEIVNLYIDSSKLLKVFSASTALSTAGFNSSTGITMVADREYLIEVAWQANDRLTVWLDGVQVLNNTGLTGATVGVAIVTTINVGIDHYDGADTNPQGPYVYWLTQVAEDNTVALNDTIVVPRSPGVDSGNMHF